jgi:hypothetical protein
VPGSRDEFAPLFIAVLPHQNEVQRREVAGAMAWGWAEAAQMIRHTVIKPTSELGSAGHVIPDDTVGRILKELGDGGT